jgi:hypothetical protein
MAGLFSRRRMIGAGGAAVLSPLVLANSAAAAAPPGGRTGQMITLVTPVRVFDSRVTPASLGGGKIAAGSAVGVPLSAATLDGSNVSVAFVNCTVTDTENAGYLLIHPSDLTGEAPLPETSNINWSQSGQTLANLVLTAVGGENYISIYCGGSGRTHFIIDLQGYVPFPP